MVKDVRVRIAPSPTGFLHIGTARTALFNYLFAKKNNGSFVLRIEDTDLERSDSKFEEDIKDGLQWLGLEWDEFYRQSERLNIYKKYIKQLFENGKAFWCYHSVEELEMEKKEQMAKKEAPRHVCIHKRGNHQSPITNHQKKQGIIRLKVDENSTRIIHFNDLVRGTVEWDQKLIGDLSIAKDGNTPLYNFAVVVDDYEMEISHVIRGEDHISNTSKQILIQETLGFNQVEYAHLPLILGSDRSKLSKRHGATSLVEFREQGYLPEAMVNFMALLGWHLKYVPLPRAALGKGTKGGPWRLTSGGDMEHETQRKEQREEIFNLDELVHHFDIKNVHKSGAVFDIKKLNWMNNFYIRQLPPEQFENAIVPFILKEIQPEKVEDDFVEKIRPMLTERLEKLSGVKEFDYLFKDSEYDGGLLKWKKINVEDTKKSLNLVKEIIDKYYTDGDFNLEDIKQKLDDLAQKEFNGDRGAVYWPLRVALSGKEKSPDPILLMGVLGSTEVVKRLSIAINRAY